MLTVSWLTVIVSLSSTARHVARGYGAGGVSAVMQVATQQSLVMKYSVGSTHARWLRTLR